MYVTRCETSKHWTNNKSYTVHTIEELSYYLHEIGAIEKKIKQFGNQLLLVIETRWN